MAAWPAKRVVVKFLFCHIKLRMLLELLYYLFQIIAAYLLGDFIMGIYHWMKDTYFSPFTPVIGQLMIWNSRLHHIRPRYVIEFSDWQLFSDSAKWTAFWMVPLMYLTGINTFMVTLFLVISLNDVVHKYAHMLDFERPKWATTLQKIGLLQSHEEHHLHHVEPHIVNYCPVTPYVNQILEHIQFWRKLENMIERYTGIKPRAKEYDFAEDPKYPAGIRFLP